MTQTETETSRLAWIRRSTYGELKRLLAGEPEGSPWRAGIIGQAIQKRLNELDPRNPPPREIDWHG